MKNTFSLLFYLKKPRNYVSGAMPIYMRITVDGVHKELSSGKHCEPNQWNTKAGRLDGKKEDARTINRHLKAIEDKVDQAHTELFKADQEITAESLKNKYLGVEEEPHTLLLAFQEHNEKVEALLGNGFKKGTLTKYNTTLKHTKSFILDKFKVSDMAVTKIDNYFITEFDFYLRSKCNCANNAAVKHIKNLGKVIRICLANRWMTHDPFLNHRNKVTKVVRVILSPSELKSIYSKEFTIERLRVVRDTFLFCCYTGLSFIDVQELTKSEIRKGVDGYSWILKNRHKTSVATHIPLLPVAEEIIERYATHPQCEHGNRVLPVFSNQKMNAYLKEIADLCEITKHLTFHIARHTFATTVTLSNGIPIESVSKMLGHTDIRTTQIYAKILDTKVGADMAMIKNKYSVA
ncbi:site-specific integrase [Pedobacter sp. L105]|uniref:site-specific integrase n=1 Tax=Pedobacter sp. L105 TaxID=1641871 RepID=UPI00131C97DC|nr:site-specific integrase [Pedobacter sp. L105]